MKPIRAEQRVVVRRDISRQEDPHYAKEGAAGVVIETFNDWNMPHLNAILNRVIGRRWYAKVLMDDGSGIKTFRLTSLRHE